MTNSPQQRRALAVQNNLSPFGNKLVQAGYASQDQIQKALADTRRSGKPLTESLELITGQQLSPDLLRQYKKQQLFELKILYGVESLDPEINQIPNSQIGHLIDTLIPIDICRRYQFVPLSQPIDGLLVAMVYPDNLDAQDDLNRILRAKNLILQRLVITSEDYNRLISQYLDERVQKDQHAEQQARVDVKAELEGLEDYAELSEEGADEVNLDTAADADAAPIVALVNKILIKALQLGVSDIHVEPQEEQLRIRFRKDGVLQQAFDSLPKKIIPAVTARFKIISQLDIAERRAPQDGRIRRVFDGRKIDFRVNTLPSKHGEKVVLRILDNSVTQLGLDNLIQDKESLEMVQEMVRRPFGLILVTGPTGSGKTTTLYSALAERNDPGVNISTAEDPIEYTLPGLTQVQVIREKGMDFAAILRAFLRQDPDVILVGETRDRETAKTAIEAALTGHLVLTTLHTNDAAGAISRLDEMGVEPFMVSGALLGVVAQRLVRRVCDQCRIPYTPTPEELGRFGLTTSRDAQLTLYRANSLSAQQIQSTRSQKTLCEKCTGSGYKGRCGVYEVMKITDRLQVMISKGAPSDQIKEVAIEEGMQTLLAYSLNLVRQGMTTLEEVERVTFTDTGLEAEMRSKRKSVLSCRTCSAELKQEWLDCPYCLTPRFQD
ncbi:MAG: ATPase, T2SS/T4P/T4SS family [Cyanobacteria bacterium]|nr:ATPase, T2SS/T4P/T4SS family [Cyanobacteriota bacterium]